MKQFFSVPVFLATFLIATIRLSGQPSAIDYGTYMQRQALTWDSISSNYYTGIILGNGRLGTNIYKESDNSLRFDVGRTDVTDHRPHFADSIFAEQLISQPRLPIGKMLLQTKGKIISANMRLDIYNAEAKGEIITTEGKVNFYALVPKNEQVIYIRTSGSGNEKDIRYKWQAEESVSPRIAAIGEARAAAFHYIPNPSATIKDSSGYGICHQSLSEGWDYATSWKFSPEGTAKVAIIAVGNSSKGAATKESIEFIQHFISSPLKIVIAKHRNWWNSYYQKSFVSIPDSRLESYYWLQLYKLASATGAGNPMIDLMGPWFTSKTPWPAIWWNLNTQLAYAPVFTANHMEIAYPLFDVLYNNRQQLINNVPESWRNDAAAIGRISSYDLYAPIITGDVRNLRFEPGNLTWTLFYYYQYFRYSSDTATFVTKIQPLLKRSVNYMIHLLNKDEQDVYHLPLSSSPEYTNAEDAHYSLSSLRWGLQILLETASIAGAETLETDKWKEVLDHLAPFASDESGLMIGRNVALTTSHRHFSHLLAIWPYRLIDPDDANDKKLIETSLHHWISSEGALQGYSFTGASSISSLLGKGDDAYHYLDQFLRKHGEANGLYKESGPCFETPMAAATSLLEMLLQSKGKDISVFPALPAEWRETAFENLLAEGAFKISAARHDGATSFIIVESLRGGNCRIACDIPQSSLKITGAGINRLDYNISSSGSKTLVDLRMKPGQTIKIADAGFKGNFKITPVAPAKYTSNYWGLKKKQQ
ncbi:hypothetical protein QTN47_08020 [Danxiaibacter flavus]|uniref:Alpha-L-fucosidase n=1 Tax=Danxiaibacter flavus TaxID=3049108 RepID=A0ABV3ZC38_9BACT|nr:hypothetical protein QNM32_08020 [Chitinophagaceae bacterium DXS]